MKRVLALPLLIGKCMPFEEDVRQYQFSESK